MESKRAAAERAVDYIHDGMIVGLGTGSTAYWAIQKIGMQVRNGLRIQAIATSIQSERLAKELYIPLTTFAEIDEIDMTIDGADEVDSEFNLIKGGGGALLREKIVAAASRQLLIIVDESKKVTRLGKFPLPVEIVKFGHEMTMRRLRKLGCEPKIRMQHAEPYVTDNGNYITDCHFGTIDHPPQLHHQLLQIPGVVDNGLFIGLADRVIVGYSNGTVQEFENQRE